jgi:shikimate dehydrogenase
MHLLGLIGFPLQHSFSQKYFTEKFLKEGITDFEYKNFELPSIELLQEIINQNKNMIGLNVTIPYKETIIKYIDHLDGTATEINAVNTVVIKRNAKSYETFGFNTDVAGIAQTLGGIVQTINGALVCGNGGASKALQYVLTQKKIKYIVVSRNKTRNAIQFNELSPAILNEFNLIVNCTPVGTFPNVDEMLPLPYTHFSNGNIYFDMVYNPTQTKGMLEAQKYGATIINGYQMLIGQAEAAWKIWQKHKHQLGK